MAALALTLGACGGDDGSQDAGDGGGHDGRDASEVADARPDASTTPDVGAMPDAAPDLAPEPPDGRDGSTLDAVDAVGEVGDVSPGDAGGVPFATACGAGSRVFTGDFDGDTVDDCAFWPANTRSLEFHKGLGGGLVRAAAVTSESPGLCLSTTSADNVVVADPNGDGRDDLVVITGGVAEKPTAAAMVLGGEDGHFRCPGGGVGTTPTLLSTYLASGATPIVGNFTGGTGDDVLLVGFTVASRGNSNVLLFTVLDGNHSPIGLWPFYTDTSSMVGATGSVTSVSVSDVNVDGKLDVVTNVLVRHLDGTGAGATTLTWYGKGDGTFQKTPPP